MGLRPRQFGEDWSSLAGIRGPFPRGGPDPYASAGFFPELVADFQREYYRLGSGRSTFSDLLTFARSGTATYLDADANHVTAATGVPRLGAHEFVGGNLVPVGLRFERNSAIDLLGGTASLATQTVTVAATRHILHFTGTGSVTLSGAATGTLNGTGSGAANRVELIFTPSAGSLTLTVTGNVDFAQLEATAGQRTSYIPSVAPGTVRNAETLTIAAADLPANTTAMSFVVAGHTSYIDQGSSTQSEFVRWRADSNNYLRLRLNTAGSLTGRFGALVNEAGNVFEADGASEITPGLNVPYRIAARNTASEVQIANGGAAGSANTGPSAIADLTSTDLILGNFNIMGALSEFRMFGADIGETGIEEASS